MKAALIYQRGETPQFTENFPEPIANGENEILISVKATAIKHLDKSRASGKHYSTKGDLSQARVIGGDGVGLLNDGSRIFAMGITGMMAEKAIVEKNSIIKLPEGIDNLTAAALPNAVAGSGMAIRFRAAMKAGETVLINGATGFTGKMAVQIAKHYGAKRIIVTGRNEQTLKSLLSLGADEIIPLNQEDESFIEQIKELKKQIGIDIVLDYLWGHSAELILEALKGEGSFTNRTRYVSIGAMGGDKIQLSAEILRSVDLQLSGSGLGSWTKEEMQKLFTEMIPEMFQLASDRKLKVETVKIALSEIQSIWDMEIGNGKRLVVEIP